MALTDFPALFSAQQCAMSSGNEGFLASDIYA